MIIGGGMWELQPVQVYKSVLDYLGSEKRNVLLGRREAGLCEQ